MIFKFLIINLLPFTFHYFVFLDSSSIAFLSFDLHHYNHEKNNLKNSSRKGKKNKDVLRQPNS